MKTIKLNDFKNAMFSMFSKGGDAVQALLCIDVNGLLVVESYSRMLNYSEKEISFLSGKKQIYIHGSGLSVLSFTKSGMTIAGKIEKIELYEVDK